MNDPTNATIEAYAKRNDSAVMRMTIAFALGGALMDIIANTISSFFMKGMGVSMLWGMWIPLCFIAIPPIHYLCRYVRDLNGRLAKLELQLAEQRPA